MDFKKVKELREKISIPLDVAIQLLKKNNGNILISEQDFHNNHINEISKVTECDFELAKENYITCNYNKVKAIEKINSRQLIITTRENPTPRNEIGFILWPENSKGERYKSLIRNDAFIPASDFDYILDDFRSVFPLENYFDQSIEECFDVCGENYFDKKILRLIIKKLTQKETKDLKAQNFINELITWLNDKLEYTDYIVIYGNL